MSAKRIDPATTVARKERVAFHPLSQGEGGVLLHLDTGAYHGVNQMGFLIWELVDRERRFDDLVSSIRAQVDDAPADLEAEVSAYVSDLSARDLLSLTPPA